MNRWILVLMLLVVGLAPVPLKAQATHADGAPHAMYRCVLANGKVQYTNLSPKPGCVVIFTYIQVGKDAYINYGKTVRNPQHSASAHAPAVRTAVHVFEKSSPSIVVVVTYDASGKPAEQGSGVKLPSRSVATNCHVLKDGPTHLVRYQGADYAATLDKADWGRDVCTLNVPGLDAPAVTLGSTKTLQVGAEVFAIGAPEGLQLTLSEGIVSSMRRVEGGSYIQTTAAISPGSSGGGLFDDQGRLLGLTSFFASKGQQLNFALPVEWIEELTHSTAGRKIAGSR